MNRRRIAPVLAGVVLAMVGGLTCTDLSGPGTALTQVGLAPRFTRAAEDALRSLASFHLALDNIRVRLNRGDGSTAVDTVVVVAPGAESVSIELTVRVNGSEGQFNALIELRAGDLVLFSGTQVVVAKTTGSSSGAPIEVEYVGPGAGAVDVDVLPSEIAILSNQTAAFTAVAFDATEQQLPDLLVEWTVRDAALGSVSDLGVFTPVAGARGSTWVIAALPTGVKDSARVTVSPIPTAAVVVSGADQTGIVGQAIAPIVFEVRAADQLPVPGVQVGFSIASGGGQLSTTSAATGPDGRVSVTLTLGTATGPNAVQLLLGDNAAASATATALAGPRAKLAMVRQPSTSATSGLPIAVQPTVRLQDVFGNNVSSSGVAVTAAISGASAITLAGTTTVNTDAEGVAVFTDLVLVGLGGSAALTFSQGSLTTVTSSSISLSPSGTPALQLETSSSVTVVVGAAISVPPSVLVKDANGNPAPGVALRVMLTAGEATFYDQSITSDANGRVLVTSLPIPTVAGTYLLTASNTGYTGSPIEVEVVVQNAELARLVFVNEPSGVAAIAGALLAPITLELYDAFDNLVTTGPTAATAVTLSLTGGTLGAVLGPTLALTQTASEGQVAFSVFVSLPGTGYAVQASAGQTVPPVTSGTFDIGAPPAPSLTLVRGGDQAVLPRSELPDSVVVRALDASSNPMTGAIVRFEIATGGGMLNNQSTPVDVTTDANGFAAVSWQVGAGTQSLTATMGGASQTINAFVADRIVVMTEPSLAPQSGVKLVQQPVVRLTDAAGRSFPTGAETIEAELVRVDAGQPSGALDFGFVTTDGNGVATFTDLSVSGPTAEVVRLRFFHQIDGENPDIAAGLSDPLTLQPGLAQFVIPAEFAHKLTPVVGQKTLTFTVNDGFNPVPAAPVTVSALPTNCALANAPTATDAAGAVTVDVTAGAALTSCRVMVQVNQAPFFATNWQRVYSVDAAIPVWTGGKIDDPDPAGWDVATNWFDAKVPSADPTVFVPGSVDQTPRADRPMSLSTLHIENFGALNLNGQTLTIDANLDGGGILQNAGDVTLNALTLGIANVVTDGNVKVGPTGSTQCSASQAAYTVTSQLHVGGTLEINCALVVNTASVVIVGGDLIVAPAMALMGLQSAGGVSIGRDAQFLNSSRSFVFDGSFSVSGKLTVATNAQFDQFKGLIMVGGDAAFNGSSTMQDGVLLLNGSMFYTGNGDNQKFVAADPHVTQFGATAGAPVISWNPIAQGTSKFGRVQILDKTATGYTLMTDNTQTVPLIIDDLLVGDGAQLTVNPLFDISANASAVSGRGVNVLTLGKLTNNAISITVPTPLQPGCSPLPRGAVAPLPFACTTR